MVSATSMFLALFAVFGEGTQQKVPIGDVNIADLAVKVPHLPQESNISPADIMDQIVEENFSGSNADIAASKEQENVQQNVKSENEDYATSFIWAAKGNMVSLLDRLLKKGANIDAKDGDGLTALMVAADSGSLDAVKFLLKNGADVKAKDNLDKTALELATAAGNREIEKLLVRYGANINTKDKFGQTPLEKAAELGDLKTMKHLLKHGANPNEKDAKSGTSVLVSAISGGCTPCVTVILDEGVDVNQRLKNDEKTVVPLIEAVLEGSGHIVSLLLERGAHIEGRNRFRVRNITLSHTPLHAAANQGHYFIAKELLGRGANLEAVDEIGATPLMLAAWRGHEPVVSLLVAKGANKDAQDINGKTALTLAQRANDHGSHDNIIKTLKNEVILPIIRSTFFNDFKSSISKTEKANKKQREKQTELWWF